MYAGWELSGQHMSTAGRGSAVNVEARAGPQEASAELGYRKPLQHKEQNKEVEARS